MTLPIFSIRNLSLGFGEKTLFSDITFHIYSNDRVALIGQNGSGKSSLMKLITQDFEPDSGEIYFKPGLKIGYLPQNVLFKKNETVYDHILQDFQNSEEKKYLADIVIQNLALKGDDLMSKLSGGKIRRAALARSLVNEPEFLLLDEPTNHLDISSIEWLESYLSNYRGAVICISHDRCFLENITNRMIFIDRGSLFSKDAGFKEFDSWQEELIQQEQNELSRLNKKLQQEELWRHQGVTARRKRNQQRMANLLQLRNEFKEQKSKLNRAFDSMSIDGLDNVSKAKIAFEIRDVSHQFDDVTPPKQTLQNFSFRAIRGEKIGVIGKNGSGKSTFIKLLVGQLKPTSGSVYIGKNIEFSYQDQDKSIIDDDKTVWRNLAPEGDYVLTHNGEIHVIAYLKKFMFDRKIADAKAQTLSGGQKTRLILAKILAKPGSLLILDEPTNDLDMDSLDILTEILTDFKGTVLIVSHDRDFLEKIVTRSLIFEKNENNQLVIADIAGSYKDFQQQNIVKKDSKLTKSKALKPKSHNNKLTYKLARLYEILPKEIENLEQEIIQLENILQDPQLFTKDHDTFLKSSKSLEEKKLQKEEKEIQWLEIAEMKDEL